MEARDGAESYPVAKRVKLSEQAAPPVANITADKGAAEEPAKELELGTTVESHLEVEMKEDAETEIVTADRQLVGTVSNGSATIGAGHQQQAAGRLPDRHSPNALTSGHRYDKDANAGEDVVSGPSPRSSGHGFDISISEKSLLIMQDEARHLDFWDWLEKYRALPFSVLFEVFGYKLTESLRDHSDEDLLPLLKAIMMKKIAKRNKRTDINTLEQVVELLQTCKNIVVLTGAGVSVSCGIPDFRSKNGIYSRLDEFDLDDPQQMFDLEYFRIQPETFYTFAREIYPSNFKPSPSHMFIKLLEEKGKLLRNYTQNIDTLEQLAGIQNVVQCHGSFATAKCIVCGYAVDGGELKEDIFLQRVPRCPRCPEENDGVMKPGITFFGEMLPDEFDRMFALDKEKVDLLIVMGSSLKVSPVADVKDKIPHDVPQILINMEALPHMAGFDVQLLGYCDAICAQLCHMLGWDLHHEKLEKLPTIAIGSSTEHPTTMASTAEEAPHYRQGRLPHQYLFEGAIGTADMDPNAYIPSDREDNSNTSSSADSDSDDQSSGGDESDDEDSLEGADEHGVTQANPRDRDNLSAAKFEPREHDPPST
ncbi:hypothetical protein PhCBS80983_g04320 [Powellomyces hirtus]|uniref:Deacetylase sirtuin-type domain-containing protein n=1 Tax=Powellomyces hirtus TaxID=109895 RepID=A0A507DZA1_9FUNG|nr:hypothetical protein PhCBS80983_g04320 [Powellomyces hirtus]